MTNLILAPTRRYFGFGDKNDFCVLDGGRCLGRIFRPPQAPEDMPWFWTITDRWQQPSINNKGYSLTLEEAMAAFKAQWAPHLKKGLPTGKSAAHAR
jgi:hypothetical protein